MLLPLLLALAQDSVRAAPRDSAPIAALERFIAAQMSQHAIPGLAIAVVDGDRVVWAKGFGRVDPADSSRTVTAETPFRVASVSKLFTDIGVMQRVERGRFHLDSAVSRYAPDFAPARHGARMPTLRELLSHRSGIVREPPVGHYFDPTSPTLAATVTSLNGTALVYAPGTVTKYSNAAIALAGRLLEIESGLPFAEVMRRDVLAPLGMNGASFAPESAHLSRRARGTMWTLDGRSFAAPTFPLGLGPASELSASMLDLAQFLRMLFAGGVGPGGRVLKEETLRAMWGEGAGAARGLFGLGFALGELDGARRIGHGGWHYGFATEVAALPDERLGVALSATIDGGNAVTTRIADEALRLMRASRASRPLPVPLVTSTIPPARRRELEGTYRGRGRSVVLEDRLGDLWLDDLRGDFPTLLRALDDSTLIADGRLRFGARVTVHRTARGVRTLRYAGDTLALVPDTRPNPPPARWRPLIGEYGWDHDVLHLLERDGRLFALIEWFGLYPLTEVDRDHLRFPAHGLYAGETLRIERDAAGRVRAVDLGGVVFARRAIAPEEGVTFRITPRRPLDDLRREALAAAPPPQPADRVAGELVDLTTVDPGIKLDVRYATSDNFMGAPMYERAVARLQRPAAEALGRAQRALAAEGFGLLIHDAYRPWYVTRMFWDATPDSLRVFVADPATGSRHNRGAAVDLTLYDLGTGRPVTMVSGYDEFSPRAYPFYPGGTSEQRWLRARLRHAMEREGFQVFDAEWWHFDHASWRRWAVGNTR
ncbi:MAG: serine hydrolase [Gemmatimonadetes bacterium]|nr:serine hydrolase [Gemmatimonadota bacterium]